MGSNRFLYLFKIFSPFSQLPFIFGCGIFFSFISSFCKHLLYYIYIDIDIDLYIFCGCAAGIEPVPPAVEVQGLNHWTAREVPRYILYGKECTCHGRFLKIEYQILCP